MTARPIPTGSEPTPQAETEPQRAARLAWEARQIDEAREDLRAGRVIADEDVDAWLDRFARGEPLLELSARPVAE